jgi:hypothetical protein
MKKYILIQKFGPQLEEEHKSRKNCENALAIAFHVQLFTSTFPELSFLVINNTI